MRIKLNAITLSMDAGYKMQDAGYKMQDEGFPLRRNRNDSKLKFLKLTKKIQELLAITNLLTVFDVSDNEQAMLSSFV